MEARISPTSSSWFKWLSGSCAISLKTSSAEGLPRCQGVDDGAQRLRQQAQRQPSAIRWDSQSGRHPRKPQTRPQSAQYLVNLIAALHLRRFGERHWKRAYTSPGISMIRLNDFRDDGLWRLFEASASGDVNGVKHLVEARPELVNVQYNYTPAIHFAVREGRLDVAEYLIWTSSRWRSCCWSMGRIRIPRLSR